MSFQVQLEKDADAVQPFELNYQTYNTFADLLSNTVASSVLSALDVDAAFSTTGLAFDGSQYIIQFERDADAGAGATVFYNTYNSFADVLSNTQASSHSPRLMWACSSAPPAWRSMGIRGPMGASSPNPAPCCS